MNFHQRSGADTTGALLEKVFLEISQKSQENIFSYRAPPLAASVLPLIDIFQNQNRLSPIHKKVNKLSI